MVADVHTLTPKVLSRQISAGRSLLFLVAQCAFLAPKRGLALSKVASRFACERRVIY